MRRPLLYLSLVFAAAVYVILRFFPINTSVSNPPDKETAILNGIIDQKERHRSDDGSILLKVTLRRASGKLSDGEALPEIPDGVLITIEPEDNDIEALDKSLPIGKTLLVQGKIRLFSPASNPGEFDSSLYYRILKINYSLQDVSLLSVSGNPDRIGDGLYRLRQILSKVLDRCFTEENASVMKAMLLGEKGFLPEELKDLYRESGIIHILAISGLHISLFGIGLYRLLKKIRVPTGLSAAVAMVFLLLYADMVRLSGSGIRALVQFMIYLGAELLQRSYDLLTAMAASLLILLLSEPYYILYSGFQFSFAAILGIGVLLPILKSRLLKILAIPLMSAPVYLSVYGTFPLWSVVLNIFVVPLMTVIMECGILVMGIGMIFPSAGIVLSYPVRVLLYFYRAASEISVSLPLHRLILGQPASWQICLYYLLLLFLVRTVILRREKREKEYPEWKKVIWIAAAVLILTGRNRRGLTLSFIDVGQGDGILVSADGTSILVDGGSSSETELGKYTLEPFLLAKGVAKLDLAVLTHDDTDHCSGLLYLLQEGYDIREIAVADMGDVPIEDRGENYDEVLTLAANRGIPVRFLERGDILRSGSLTMYCVHPSPDESYLDDVNQDSVTFLLTYGKFSSLLTGDLEQEGEEDCLSWCRQQEEEGKLPEIPSLTVLKCGHHGSRYATSSEWLEKWKPEIAVISCGLNNRYHHPAEETISRLLEAKTQIEDTRFDGEIEFRTDGEKLEIRRFLK